MIIRPEQIDDYEEIAAVNRLAFGRDNEARLVERLRGTPEYHPGLSLVAVLENKLVGHILFSLISIESEGKRVSGPSASACGCNTRPTATGSGRRAY